MMGERKSVQEERREKEREARGCQQALLETAKALKGNVCRLFLARTVWVLGEEGQRLVERELGRHRGTIRKDLHEREGGVVSSEGWLILGHEKLLLGEMVIN